ncbi:MULTISPECIES: 50S ribosomal protein L13 [Gordonia]|uniref:Large ribosomal subunit protein uL13 n=3 Tax=Gordonia TaxID=2053 RepID=A0AAW4G2Q5_GORRU|nr:MULTISPECIES: 50S ribosomal protein L13 [Gordonia]ASR02472.1 50S ribosomal protein L13 [Gordonia rubripertincta]MBM7277436.1 50S ribosomal protein L13 [Gordonia rubripertincta]MCK8615928.1 50S ribosomal protein L13 [Gordonia sp. C13]MDG6780215.1 50S ribosomal protein L13 [Gordonia rubripertincta]NKY63502.1 50S ribosomal protein L13 [Gordonia rubripertincta]
MPTYTPKAGDITRTWHVIDATDVVLGRLAVQTANLLRGKHKPTYAPHMDGGDFVIIINAEKVALTSNKAERKLNYTHSGHPGGLKSRTTAELLETFPERVIEKAVKGMLPSNKLGRAMASKLKVYAGPNHPHAAQRPVPFEIKQVAQ